jgi:AraC family transcriptional regulator, regulatory protein of adaptative response / methylated-DNA-[protein]-cysteine methyltransferase
MNPEKMWQAVLARDASVDGKFYYGVHTTGVYCCPSCKARLPLRKNVRFYKDSIAAERAGLRPCRRCRPRDLDLHARLAKRIAEICRYIDRHAAERLTLTALAQRAHVSVFHFQRSFKEAVGVTPKQYVDAARIRMLKGGLRAGHSTTAATYDAGFGSGSRVYERADTRLGMTPSQYRSGGKGVGISYVSAPTPLGLMLLGATDRGLCFLQFGSSQPRLVEQLQAEYPQATIAPMPGTLRQQFDGWMKSLADYLAGGARQLQLPIDVRGTAFQTKVWRYLQRIPHGQVQSYAEVATGIGAPAAVRAVANACASNRVALAIPCHRVIRGDGSLGGYRWGLERKRTLIDMERARKKD